MTEETMAPGVPETPAPVETVAPETPVEVSADVPDSSPAPDQPGISARDAFEHPEVKKRLDQMTYRFRDVERLLADMQDKPAAPEQPLKAPTAEEYGFDEARLAQANAEYLEQLADRAAERKLAERFSKMREAESVRTFETRAADFARSVPDFEQVAHYDAPINQPMAQVIRESEIGPQIAYYLGKNREIGLAIAELPPLLAAREIGKIEAALLKPPPPPKPKISNAPAPPPKIEATEPEVEKDPLKMTDAEFSKWRKRQIAQRR
jgi:hypothetical protein